MAVKKIRAARHYQPRNAALRALADGAQPGIRRDLKASLDHLTDLVDSDRMEMLIRNGLLGQAKTAVHWNRYREVLTKPFGRMAQVYQDAAQIAANKVNGRFSQAGRRFRYKKDFNPDQPRAPAGTSIGGQWVGDNANKPGIQGTGVVEADRIKKKWEKHAPDDVDKIMVLGRTNQALLGRVGAGLAEQTGAVLEDNGQKTRQSLERKIGMGRAPASVSDAVRIGFKVTTPGQSDEIVAALARHFALVDEGWYKTPAGYFDRKVIVRFANGQMGEVQFWHPTMLAAKETGGGHALYEEWRAPGTTQAQKIVLEQRMRDVYEAAAAQLPSDWKAVLGKAGS